MATRARRRRDESFGLGAKISIGCAGLMFAVAVIVEHVPKVVSNPRRDERYRELTHDAQPVLDAVKRYRALHEGASPPDERALLDAREAGVPLLQAVDGKLPQDHWGRALIYESSGSCSNMPYVQTLGADGLPGGSGEDSDMFVDAWKN